jgi:tetratricopeptide (TPR) repeat protein
MPESQVHEWCDRLVRASRDEDFATLDAAATAIAENAAHISGEDAEAALAAIGFVTATVLPEPGFRAVSAGLELIRRGAAPDPLVGPLFGTLRRMLGLAAGFLETWEYCVALDLPHLEAVGVTATPPDPDEPDVLGTPPDPALAIGLQAGLALAMAEVNPMTVQRVEEMVQSWWHLGQWAQAAVTLLPHLPHPVAEIPRYADIVETLLGLTMADVVADVPYRCDTLNALAARLSGSPVDYWTTTVLRAHIQRDGRLFRHATRQAIASAEGCAPRALESALEPLAEVITSAPPIIGRWAALTGGALVEMGAPPDGLVAPVFLALRHVMELACEFEAGWRGLGAAPLPDPEGPGQPETGTEAEHRVMTANAEALVPRLGERAYEVTMGWWALGSWTLPANALLNHSPRIRTLIPDPDRLTALLADLLPAASAMAGLRHRLRHLADHLSDVPGIGHDESDVAHPADHHVAHPADHHADAQAGQSDARLDAAAELTTAALLADAGDLATAAAHIGTALAYAPDLPTAYEALFKLAARAGDEVFDLFPMAGHHLAYGIGRAHLLGAGDDPDAGLDLLVAVIAYAPERPWAVVPWVVDPEVPRRMHPDRIAESCLRLGSNLPHQVPEDFHRALMPLLELGRNAVAAHPRHGLLHGAVAGLARRLGAPDEAIALAARGEQLDPSLLTAMCAASAYSAGGRVEEALSAYQRMLAFDPQNTAVHTDIAELLADAGRYGEAMEWIDRALAIAPRDPAAFPTACALRFAGDRDVAHLVALAAFLQEHPDSEHAHRMLAAGCADHPWLAAVPPGLDDAASFLDTPGALAGFRAETAGGPDPWIGFDTLPLPSPMAVLARVLPGVPVRVGAVPQPDPRNPRRWTDTVVWTYDGTVARPAIPVPSPDGARAVADLAMLAMTGWPFPGALHAASAHLAGLPIGDLLGTLVHPPEPPAAGADQGARLPETLWVRTVQAIACVGILHHRTGQSWMFSTRRRILVDLAFGVEDWITEAALFALVVAAWVDPGARSDVAGLVAARLADVVELGARRRMPLVPSVASLALAAPGLSAAARELAGEAMARAYAEFAAGAEI